MSYLIWTPLIFAFYLLYAYLTKQTINHGGGWFWALLVANAFPGWPLVANSFKYTENEILTVALVYDAIMVITVAAGLVYFTGAYSKLNYINWIGLTMVVAGLFMVKNRIF